MRSQDPRPDACARLLAVVALIAARKAIAAARAGQPHQRLIAEAESWLLDLPAIEPHAGWADRAA